MTKFVIVGTQRSGTTLLRTLLDSHPDVLCLGETFYINRFFISENTHRKNPKAKSMGMGRSETFTLWKEFSYRKYISRSFRRKLMHMLINGRSIEQYLDELYAMSGYDAIGFKVMMNQLNKYSSILPYIKNQDFRVIHILRNNVLSILLSALSMEARGYSHSPIGGNAVKLSIPVNNLEERLSEIQFEGKKLKNLFENDSEYMMIIYEEFIDNKDAYGGEMLEFLGVDSSKKLSSELVKLNTAPISDYVENIDEVQRALSGTQFAWCVEELL